MGLVQDVGVRPVGMPVNAEAIVEGYVYKISTYLTKITAKGDTAYFVADQSTLDAEGSARTMTAGDTVPMWPIGSGAIVDVASETGVTYAFGDVVYLADSTDGMINKTAATSRPIGYYMGRGATTTANGDLVPIMLSKEVGAATV